MKNGKPKKVLVKESLLQDVIFLLNELMAPGEGTYFEMSHSVKRLKKLKDMKDRLQSAIGNDLPVKSFYDMFKSFAGYRYVVDQLIKFGHVEEIDDDEYKIEYSRIKDFANQMADGSMKAEELLLELRPYTPPLIWRENKMYFAATIKEIYNKGYFKGRLSSINQMPTVAKYFFSIDDISLSAINQSTLHPKLIGKIKNA